ncbi:MAG: TolC family outer membrane protein [Alphaproteobacteria bacterium]|nr:TolC family outer membrane protein [Alphaproteobacteria bacterium]
MTRLRLSALAALFLVMASPALAETHTLEETLALAYRNNPGLQAERARLRVTDEQVSQAMSGWRPSVDAVAEGGKSQQTISGAGFFTGSDTLTPHDAGITVTQPVFRGFRTEGAVKEAEAQVRAGRAALLNAEQQLLFDSAKAYLDVVRGQKVLELTRNNEDVLRQQLAATNERFRIGEVTKTDVSQSESRLNAATAARIRAEGDLANGGAVFYRLIGDEPGNLRQPKLVLESPQSSDEAKTLAEKNNPGIIAASYGQDAAKAGVTAAEGGLLPEVNLVGNVSRGWEQSVMIPGRQDNATIMARLTIPLYRSGADYSKARAARQTVTQRRLELEDARHKAHEIAIRAWQNLTTARAAITAHKSVVTAADLALHGVKEEAKVGTRTTLDVLNAEQELLNAKVDLVKAEHAEAVAILQVKAAVGALTAEALRLPVETYDPSVHYEDVRDRWIGLGNGGEE